MLEYQNLIDPEGVQARLSNRLVRREYFSKGPNFLIHIDGYDKIKKYGFGIHGAICGYFSVHVVKYRKVSFKDVRFAP